MIRDRGSIKWTSLMLPEHVKELKRMWKDESRKPRPILDEQKLEVLNTQLLEAFKFSSLIEVTIYQNGTEATLTGNVEKLDAVSQRITLQSKEDSLIIPVSDIIHLEIIHK
ncbi:MAG: YolD-like family protein [Bacillaceae bacterium]|nr:YolD-like family protein [Bacillaceae bacterium]